MAIPGTSCLARSASCVLFSGPGMTTSVNSRSIAAPLSRRSAADIRIATPSIAIGNPETGLGILAAAGAGWRLKEIVGGARAIELLLTGRTVKAEEALRIGLVSAIHEPADLLPAAHAIVDRIVRNDPAATIATKRVFRAPRDHHPAVDLEAQAELFESPEKFRRMTDFLERRDR